MGEETASVNFIFSAYQYLNIFAVKETGLSPIRYFTVQTCDEIDTMPQGKRRNRSQRPAGLFLRDLSASIAGFSFILFVTRMLPSMNS